MSGGWIKCDKDFLDDPRLLAAAIKLRELYLVAHRTPGGGRDLSPNDEVAFWRDAVTGASLRLWRYAHEHICDDDTLPCDAVTINAIVGIEGFCDVMPDDWLQILDDGETVKLPGYCAKNNLKSLRKRNSSSAERMRKKRARDRERNRGRNDQESDGVTHSVTPTSQSALDQDQDLDLDLDLNQDQEGRGKGSSNLKGLRDKGEEVFTKSAALPPPQNGKHDPRSFEVIKSNVLAIAEQFKTSDPEKLYKFGHNAYRLSRDQCRAAAKQLREDGEFDRLQIAL